LSLERLSNWQRTLKPRLTVNVTKMATKSVSFALAIAIAKTAVSVVNPHANVASLHHDREKQ